MAKMKDRGKKMETGKEGGKKPTKRANIKFGPPKSLRGDVCRTVADHVRKKEVEDVLKMVVAKKNKT